MRGLIAHERRLVGLTIASRTHGEGHDTDRQDPAGVRWQEAGLTRPDLSSSTERSSTDAGGGTRFGGSSVVDLGREHQAFTNAWRRAFPYGTRLVGVTREAVLREAARIYADHPVVLHASGI